MSIDDVLSDKIRRENDHSMDEVIRKTQDDIKRAFIGTNKCKVKPVSVSNIEVLARAMYDEEMGEGGWDSLLKHARVMKMIRPTCTEQEYLTRAKNILPIIQETIFDDLMKTINDLQTKNEFLKRKIIEKEFSELGEGICYS